MKGNLSKKKGFLRDLENNDLSSISDILEDKYGKELVEVKNSITALDGIKENVDNRIDEISETTNERRGKYASAEAVYDYGQKIKNEANEYTDGLENKHNERFNTVETNLGTIQTELTEQLNKIEAKVEKEIQDLESKHDKSIKTVEEDITALEEKKENVANRTDKISETTNERRGKYASAEAVYRYGSEIKNKANEYTDVMFDDVVVQFEEADKVIRSDVANVRTLANDAYNIAKGASRAIAFENYQKFCEYILEEGEAFKENYPVGTTILIATSGVPDLWYYGESAEYEENIPTDEVIMENLAHLGWFEIGYYRFAQLENQNVNLEGYVSIGEFNIHADNKNLHTTAEEKQKWNAKLDKSNQNGGFVAGNYQEDEYAQDTSGVVIGKNAHAEQHSNVSPVVIGEDARSNDGVAIGYNAGAIDGGTSIGVNASGGGVSIGNGAKAIGRHDVIIDGEFIESIENYPIDAIQLGSGTNKNEKTLQVYDFQLLDAEGNIPKERLKNAGGGSVDLSGYFTKNETTEMIDFAMQNAIDSAKSEIKVAFEENKTNNITDSLGSGKCPTVEAVHEYGQSLINSCNSFTTDYVAQAIGNIETALDELHSYAQNLIGGGDA